MSEYYFIVSLLPELEIGHVPALGMEELKELLCTNLEPHDRVKCWQLLRQVDVENFRAFWAKEPLDSRGNLKQEQMEEVLNSRCWSETEEFPDYLIDYLDKYPEDADKIAHFQDLLVLYFADEIEKNTDFLREYFAFQREWQLVLVGFRAKKVGKDIAVELQHADSSDPIVAQILAQKDAAEYEPPFEYKELRPIFEEHSQSPLELHKALVEYQFHEIVERWGVALFSVDRILNYMARLLLVERWQDLDVQKGIGVIDKIEEGVR